MNEPQLSAEMEKKLINKNVHSVYTLCYECHGWGVNLPLNHKCGNCNSSDTMIYYDIETVTLALATALEEQRQKIKEYDLESLKYLRELCIEDDLLDLQSYGSIGRVNKIGRSWEALKVIEKLLKGNNHEK